MPISFAGLIMPSANKVNPRETLSPLEVVSPLPRSLLSPLAVLLLHLATSPPPPIPGSSFRFSTFNVTRDPYSLCVSFSHVLFLNEAADTRDYEGPLANDMSTSPSGIRAIPHRRYVVRRRVTPWMKGRQTSRVFRARARQRNANRKAAN